MVYYKGFTIYYLGLNRYKITVRRWSIAYTDTFAGGLKEVLEVLKVIDAIDNDLKGK